MLPEVRMARITDAIELHRKKKLSCVEAGALLGMSERHFRRLRGAYEERGAEGIIDRRRGRTSGRRAGVDEIAWVVEEFRTRYFDFTAKPPPSTSMRRSTGGRWRTASRLSAVIRGPRAVGPHFSGDKGGPPAGAPPPPTPHARAPPQEAGAPAPARHASLPGRL